MPVRLLVLLVAAIAALACGNEPLDEAPADPRGDIATQDPAPLPPADDPKPDPAPADDPGDTGGTGGSLPHHGDEEEPPATDDPPTTPPPPSGPPPPTQPPPPSQPPPSQPPPADDPPADDPPATTTCTAADAWEPNDLQTQARTISLATSIAGEACGDDVDWFRFTVGAACDLTVQLDFVNADGDLDLALYASDGTELDTSSGIADGETITYTTTAQGIFAARVLPYSGAANDYTISATTSCSAPPPPTDPCPNDSDPTGCAPPPPALSCPADDIWEPNDDAYSSLSIFDGETLDGIVCSNDPDVWALWVPQNCAAVVELSFTDANGDLDLTYYGPDGQLMESSEGTTDLERIVEVANTSGEHFAKIAGYAGASNTYDVFAETVCREDFTCPSDDPFEPNDSRTAARHLDGVDRAIGRTCGDDDWFTTEVPASCWLWADLSFSDAEGDLDLEIVDEIGNVLGSSDGTTDYESTYAYSNGGNLSVRVTGYYSAQASYLLTTEVGCY